MIDGERTTASIWDRRYGEPGFAFGTEPNAFLQSCRPLFRPGDRVLVPGDGEGRNGVFLAALGARVTTVDASRVGVGKAVQLAAARGVTLEAHVADLVDWSWPLGGFDAVASIFLHFMPDERRAMHRRMLAALRPGGVMVLECYAERQLARRKPGSVGGPPPEMLPSLADLAADVRDDDVERLEEVETVLSEGSRHVGPSTVLRLVARRRAA